jgi:hypothetical protein
MINYYRPDREAELEDAEEADRWARAHNMDADAWDRAVDIEERRRRG